MGKLPPYDFLALMAVGQLGMKHPSLAGMVAAIEARISRVGLHHRFTAAAAAFLFKCLGFVLQQKCLRAGGLDTKLLRPFSRVLLADSSSWDVNEKLSLIFPGSGGAASAANCKLQVVYDYKSGELQFLEENAGTIPDNKYTGRLPALLKKGDLLLFDQGYFKFTTLSAIVTKEAFFLTRFPARTLVKDPVCRQPLDLLKRLGALQGNACEIPVLIGGDKTPEVECRLIALRVTEQVANERRRRLNAEAKKKGRAVSKRHLAFCDWTLLLTNVPEVWLPLELARALYMVRWQIELLFKQLKSILRIHQSDTGKEHRLRCELYGKLIGATLIHRIHAAETVRHWNTKRREVSMDKLYKRLQERAFTLLRLLLSSLFEALHFLSDQLKFLIPTCLKDRQPSRPTTLEILEAQFDPSLAFSPGDSAQSQRVT